MNLGGPEILIVLVLLLVLGSTIFAIVDVARRPDSQFRAAGQNRAVWLLVNIAALVIPCVWLGSLYYLVAVRPKLDRAA